MFVDTETNFVLFIYPVKITQLVRLSYDEKITHGLFGGQTYVLPFNVSDE